MSDTKLVYSEMTETVYAGKFSQRDEPHRLDQVAFLGYQSANGKVHDVTQSFIDCVIRWVGEDSERTIRAGDREWTIRCSVSVDSPSAHG